MFTFTPMKLLCGFSICLIFCSCNFFNTEKITSESFYEEEMKTITWNEVDTLPTFSECAAASEKEDQQMCFLKIFKREIISNLDLETLKTHHSIFDTIHLDLKVTHQGNIELLHFKADSTLLYRIPDLEQKISTSIQQLPEVEPALKRGIPVTMQWTFPIIIKTDTTIN